MDHYNIKDLEVRWDQGGFERMQAAWSPARREKDEAQLMRIFAHAVQLPTLKKELEWAAAHGIEFFIDRNCTGVGGYYTPGTGVVAIAAMHSHFTYNFVSVLAHELRHAWQDYHGLIQGPTQDFAAYAIKNAMVEADAYAFERRAYDEDMLLGMKGNNVIVARDREKIRAVLHNEEVYYATQFLNWFTATRRPGLYGEAAAKHAATSLGLSTVNRPDHHHEFGPHYTGYGPDMFGELGKPIGDSLDITDTQRVLQLGKTFSGRNYLTEVPRDVLVKKVLSRGLALSFYKAANDDQKQLTATLRKNYLRGKLSP